MDNKGGWTQGDWSRSVKLEEFMARYKEAAGFAIEALNAAPPIIAPGARVARG